MPIRARPRPSHSTTVHYCLRAWLPGRLLSVHGWWKVVSGTCPTEANVEACCVSWFPHAANEGVRRTARTCKRGVEAMRPASTAVHGRAQWVARRGPHRALILNRAIRQAAGFVVQRSTQASG